MSRSALEPLRQVTEDERKELQRVSRASSEPRIRHQRAVALLAVSEGKSLSEAARLVGWKGHDPVTKVTRRFNSMRLRALDDLPRPGPHRRYGPAEQARILQEAQRTPDRKEDATGTWSLTLLQRALRSAPDGLPKVSTFTILYTLHEAGYSWQKDRTWCHTGRTLKKGKDGTVYQSEDPYTQEKKGRTQTYLGEQYRQIGKRRGKKRAAVAVGHSILVIFYHMMQTGEPYKEKGVEYLQARINQRVQRRLIQRLERLGYQVSKPDPMSA